MSDLAGTWVREFGYRGAHMTSVTESPAVADSSEALHTEIIRDDLGRISGVDSPAGLVMHTYTDAQMLSSAVRGTETLRWTYDAAGALVRVEYFDSAQPQNAWVKVLVTDEGARVHAVCLYGVQNEAKTGSQSAEFASAVEDAQAWLGQCPESVEREGVTLVPVATSVFSYDGNDSRLLQVSSDGSGSSLTYGAAGFVNSVASWGSADDSAVSFSLLCASTDGRVLAAGGAPAGVPEFGVPSTGARANAGFDASVMHPLVWDENSFVPCVLGVGGSWVPSAGSLVPGAGSGAGLLDPYGWVSLGVVAPAVPSAQGASATGGAPVLPDSLVGVSAASGVVLGSTGFEVLGARVVDSRVARFTAPDPLSAPVGVGWGADPFSLVGGNPVSLVDPWGLSPVSVEDFNKQKAVAAFVRDTLEYVAGSAMVATGFIVAAIATGTGPVGGAILGGISGALMGAGMSVIEQKASGGKVDWSKAGKEAFKGAITGAVTGLVTGGLGNLKNLATGVTKVTQTVEKVSKLKQAASAVVAKVTAPVAKVTAPVKSALTPYAQKFGVELAEDKILEDVVKDSVSGGINNVVSYYLDDNVKDKNPLTALGMFASGATAGLGGAVSGGIMKSGFGLPGYHDSKRSPFKNLVLPAAPAPTKHQIALNQTFSNKPNSILDNVAVREVVENFRDSLIDASAGMVKNGLQYHFDSVAQGKLKSGKELEDKLKKGFSDDLFKGLMKAKVKMSPTEAQSARSEIINKAQMAGSRVKSGISDSFDWSGEFFDKIDLNKWDI